MVIDLLQFRSKILYDHDLDWRFSKGVIAFIEEPTGYEKTILSDLQGAWSLLRQSVVDNRILKFYGVWHKGESGDDQNQRYFFSFIWGNLQFLDYEVFS